MAAFTTPSREELTRFLAAAGIDKADEYQAIAGGSVNSNFTVTAGGRRWFLRLYEEQDLAGATRDVATVRALAESGVPTPAAAFGPTLLAGRPAALFPWVEGSMRCQASVAPSDTEQLGAALAAMHLAGGSLDVPAGRFESAALRARLTRIAEEAPGHYPVERLRRALDESDRARDPTLPAGLVHGDLFRDNVLWNGASLAALLDFESAHRGALAYDLAVCTLAWCYGDAFDDRLSRALVAGYETVRPLSEAEHRALPAEMRFAAVRFAITRITDYAMRPPEGRVMKDWKRFLARLDALTG